MTKQQVMEWYREAATLVQRGNQLQGGVTQINAMLRVMPAKEREELQRQKADALDLLGTVEQEVATMTKRDGLSAAEELLKNVEVRVKLAEELEQQLRVARAQFEMAATMSEFTDADERAEAERLLAEMQTRAETQLSLAAQLIPSTSKLLTV